MQSRELMEILLCGGQPEMAVLKSGQATLRAHRELWSAGGSPGRAASGEATRLPVHHVTEHLILKGT